jgi:hypothetical protein
MQNPTPEDTTEPTPDAPVSEMHGAPLVPADAAPLPDTGLPAAIAPHLEAIYRTAVAHAEAAAKPSLFSDIKAHASDMLHSIRNGVSVAEGDFVAKLEKLVSLL